MKPKQILLALAIAVITGAAVGWLLSADTEAKTGTVQPSKSPLPKLTTTAAPKLVPKVDQQPVRSTDSVTSAFMSKPKSPMDLLTEFELTGDRNLLVQAQKWFPHDKRVIMATCLTATDPKSTWLLELENMQPDNTLPNLMKAGILAKKGDLKGFQEELVKASGKGSLDTMLRERQAELLDRILVGKGILPRNLFGTTDMTFFQNLELIYKTFTSSTHRLGDVVDSASTAVMLGSVFRKMSDLGVSYAHYGNMLELGMLQKIPSDVEYGESGMSAAQRANELKAMVGTSERTMSRYNELIHSPSADPVVRLQYYARLRSDGEVAALEWLFALPTKSK
jgi:hypothetical protein